MKKIFEFFFLGILTAFCALILEITVAEIVFLKEKTFLLFVFLFPLIEEFLKFVFIFKKIASFSVKTSSLVYATVLGAGFAFTEIFFLRMKYLSLDESFWNIVAIFIIHFLSALAIGYGIKKYYPSFIKSLLLGLLTAFLIHSAYNAFRFFQI